jgi:lipopolysaccharide/colanic/teichoic acid biosynthesis glycosyltransferase
MSTENLTLLTRPSTAAISRSTARVLPATSIAKRAFDILVSGIALILLLPIMLVVALAVFISSPGRVDFRQKRIGFEGEGFRIIKFRTMVADAERRLRTDHELRALYLANNHKIPAHLDTRITRIGRFLRATSLDELPQFWNVFVGHMSLVGPRPIVTGELERYGEMAPVYESVRPGLTGVWQASGRSTVSYEERVQMDVDYVANWSFKNDLIIILKTIPAVLKRHGAH